MRIPFFRSGAADVNVLHSSDQGNVVNLGATPLAGGATITVDLDVSGYTTLRLFGRIGNASTPATAVGDVLVDFDPYEADGVTPWNGNWMSSVQVDNNAALQGNIAYLGAKYDVSGFSKIQLKFKNNNVAALQGGYLDYFLQ